MNFADFPALAWLLPTAGIVVALYLLKIKRKDLVVPAAFLWPEVKEDVRADSLFQKLRFSWLLILQLLALACLATALARPQLLQSDKLGGATVFVVDASLSMSAKDGSPTRLDAAKKIVLDAVKLMKPGDRAAVIESTSTAIVRLPLSDDASKAGDALAAIKQTDEEGGMTDALELAAELVGKTDGSHIVVVSDGCFPQVKDFNPGKASLQFQKVGTSSFNLSVESLGARQVGDKTLLYCGVHNDDVQDRPVDLDIYADGQLIDTSTLVVPAGKSAGHTVPVGPAQVYEAHIKTGDILSDDDYAATLALGNGQVKALLVTKGDVFLEKVLTLDPRVSLDRASTLPSNASEYDLVVLDGVGSGPTGARTTLAFGASASSAKPVTGAHYVSATSDPMVNGADFSEFSYGSVYPLSGSVGKALVSGTSGPVVTVSKSGDGRTLVRCGIDPLRSEFPLDVAFPVFIGNILDSVAEKPATGVQYFAPGRAFAWPAKGDLTVTDPSGASQRIKENGGFAFVPGLPRAGTYKLASDGKVATVFVSTQDVHDSDTKPRPRISVGNAARVQGGPSLRHADQWKWVVLAVLLVLAGEWWLFARKS